MKSSIRFLSALGTASLLLASCSIKNSFGQEVNSENAESLICSASKTYPSQVKEDPGYKNTGGKWERDGTKDEWFTSSYDVRYNAKGEDIGEWQPTLVSTGDIYGKTYEEQLKTPGTFVPHSKVIAKNPGNIILLSQPGLGYESVNVLDFKSKRCHQYVAGVEPLNIEAIKEFYRGNYTESSAEAFDKSQKTDVAGYMFELTGGSTKTSALPVASTNAPKAWKPGDDWRDDQCKSQTDEKGKPVTVCQARYDGDKTYIGVYWDDGKTEIVGSCDTPQDLSSKGLTGEAVSKWAKTLCKIPG